MSTLIEFQSKPDICIEFTAPSGLWVSGVPPTDMESVVIEVTTLSSTCIEFIQGGGVKGDKGDPGDIYNYDPGDITIAFNNALI